MRTLLTTLAATALLAAPAGAAPLSKQRAYEKAYDVLETHQVVYLFDREPILGWQLQPARECERLSARRVRCAFRVERREPLGECGGTVTLIRRSWYIGWRISSHPWPDAPCDARAARAALGRPSVRMIR